VAFWPVGVCQLFLIAEDVLAKLSYTPTRLHGVTTQKTTIGIYNLFTDLMEKIRNGEADGQPTSELEACVEKIAGLMS
jgi:hypothetical protein